MPSMCSCSLAVIRCEGLLARADPMDVPNPHAKAAAGEELQLEILQSELDASWSQNKALDSLSNPFIII